MQQSQLGVQCVDHTYIKYETIRKISMRNRGEAAKWKISREKERKNWDRKNERRRVRDREWVKKQTPSSTAASGKSFNREYTSWMEWYYIIRNVCCRQFGFVIARSASGFISIWTIAIKDLGIVVFSISILFHPLSSSCFVEKYTQWKISIWISITWQCYRLYYSGTMRIWNIFRSNGR